MRPIETDVKVRSTLEGEEIRMGIDTESLAFLQGVLTDLYSDPILAVVREYSTNAWDSHLEANAKRPIEIDLPNALSPYFKVKDYGVGLSVGDLKTIYSKYLASTRRNSNLATGMIGVGSKSALTYTNQFTMTIVKDGMLANVIVSRDADNVGEMHVMSHVATDLPNGVEISIPVKHGDYEAFKVKAQDFFSYWATGRALLDGQEPKLIEGKYLTDDILIQDIKNRNRYAENNNKLVMGGVSYNITKDALFGNDLDSILSNYLPYNSRIIFFVEIGEVHFTPSREELHYTKKTKAKLQALIRKFNASLESAVQRDIDSQPTHHDAVTAVQKWRNIVSKMPFCYYKGELIPQRLVFDESYSVSEYSTNRHEKNRCEIGCVHFIENNDYFLIVDRPADKILTSAQKAKLRILAKEEYGIGSPKFFFNEKDAYSPWTDSVKKIKWQEFINKKISRPRNPAKPDSFVYIGRYGRTDIDSSNIDVSKTMLWVASGELQNELGAIYHWSEEFNCQVYVLPQNKVKKFLKLFPQAVPIKTWATKKIYEYNSSLTNSLKEKLGFVTHRSFDKLRYFDANLLKDPELQRLVGIAKNLYADGDQSLILDAERKKYYLYSNLQRSVGLFNLVVGLEDPADILDKYPLIGHVSSYHKHNLAEHMTLYINAVYEKEQQSETYSI